jgi:signal transduction histidine kinase
MNKITPADISDPQELIARAKALSVELGTPITPGFDALVFKASRGIEDIYELTYFRKDGSRFPAVVSVTALRDAQDAIIGYLLIGTDNTARWQVEEERKRAETALRETNVKLEIAKSAAESANLAKSDFLSSMSHELRTPLNAIIGFTGTLLMKLPGPLTQDQNKQLRTVQTSARQLLALINDLLDVAKIEAGKVDLHLEPVDCKALVEEVAASLRPQAAAKGLSFDIRVTQDVVIVRSDRRALSQIVTNLTHNAIKFTERGSVRVTVDKRRGDGKGVVEIGVHDTGVGILPEDEVKLFAAFTRVNISNSKGPEGTGLGLHLSQRLAELLGGKITLQSDYGKGSTFTLVLSE